MIDKQSANFSLTHSILNYQSAQLRGHLAFQKALLQLSYQAINPEDCKQTEGHLSAVIRWNKELLQGMPIFSIDWNYPETTAAQKALKLVEEIRTQISEVNNELRRIAFKPNPFAEAEDLKYLIACYLRYTYSNENYIKGEIEYHNFRENEEQRRQFENSLPLAGEEIRAATAIFKEFRQQGKVSDEKQINLQNAIVRLLRLFRSYEHDLRLMQATYSKSFDFEAIGLSEAEAARWKELNFTAAEAGYWLAYDFPADHAVAWYNAGFSNPSAAFSWAVQGFSIEEALVWSQLEPDARKAVALVQAGHSPQSWADHLKRQAFKAEQQKSAA